MGNLANAFFQGVELVSAARAVTNELNVSFELVH